METKHIDQCTSLTTFSTGTKEYVEFNREADSTLLYTRHQDKINSKISEPQFVDATSGHLQSANMNEMQNDLEYETPQTDPVINIKCEPDEEIFQEDTTWEHTESFSQLFIKTEYQDADDEDKPVFPALEEARDTDTVISGGLILEHVSIKGEPIDFEEQPKTKKRCISQPGSESYTVIDVSETETTTQIDVQYSINESTDPLLLDDDSKPTVPSPLFTECDKINITSQKIDENKDVAVSENSEFKNTSSPVHPISITILTDKKFHCHVCNKTFYISKGSTPESHRLKHDFKLPCMFCSYYFIHSDLPEHLRECHLYCGACNKRFDSNELYITHDELHKQKKIYVADCVVCLQRVPYTDVEKHYAEVHFDVVCPRNKGVKYLPPDRVLLPQNLVKKQCSYCFLFLVGSSRYEEHLKVKHGIKHCTVCKKHTFEFVCIDCRTKGHTASVHCIEDKNDSRLIKTPLKTYEKQSKSNIHKDTSVVKAGSSTTLDSSALSINTTLSESICSDDNIMNDAKDTSFVKAGSSTTLDPSALSINTTLSESICSDINDAKDTSFVQAESSTALDPSALSINTTLSESICSDDDIINYAIDNPSSSQSFSGKKFYCVFCEQCFYITESNNWKTHKRKHDQVNFHLPCTFCKEIVHRKKLTEHLEKFHLYCGACTKTLPTIKGFKEHKMLHESAKIFVEYCKECKSRIPSDDMEEHYKSHHANEECPELRKRTPFLPKLAMEERILINQVHMQLQCGYCNAIYINFTAYNEHLQHKHGIFLCKRCKFYSMHPDCKYCIQVLSLKQKSTSTSSTISSETTISASINKTTTIGNDNSNSNTVAEICPKNKIFYCKICKKLNITQSGYLAHMLKHDAIDFELPCTFCKETFQRRDIPQHLEKDHMYCGVCNVTFSTAQETSAHRVLHDDCKIFVEECAECGRRVMSNIMLKHFKIAHPMKKYPVQSVRAKNTYIPFPLLEESVLIEQTPTKYQCCYCCTIPEDIKSFNDHLKSKHGIFLCKSCNLYSLFLDCKYCSTLKRFKNKEQAENKNSTTKTILENVSIDSENPKLCSTNTNDITSTNGQQQRQNLNVESNKNLLYCLICDTVYTSLLSLQSHQRKHVQFDFELPCIFCEQSFHRRDMGEHLKQAHLYCGACNKLFDSIQMLSLHDSQHKESKIFVEDCMECGVRLPSSEIQMHYFKEHMFKSCPSLTQRSRHTFLPLSLIEERFLIDDATPRFQCSYCRIIPRSKEHYDAHLLTVHEIFLCNMCNKYSLNINCCKVTLNDLSANEEIASTSTTSENNNSKMKSRDKKISITVTLNDYSKMESGEILRTSKASEMTSISDECASISKIESSGSTRTVTASNIDYLHNINDTKMFTCNICNISLRTPDLFEVHLMKHDNIDFELPCVLCKKNFERRDIPKHLEKFHFYCGVCNKTFKSLNDIVSHELFHKENRIFVEKCIECGHTLQTDEVRVHYLCVHRMNVCPRISLRSKHTYLPLPIVEESVLVNQIPRKLQCSYCRIIPANKNSYDKHLQDIHGIKLCRLCNKYSLISESCKYCLVKDVKDETCDANNMEIVNNDNDTHINTTLQSTSETYKCVTCETTYSNVKNYENHKKRHLLLQRKLPCLLCKQHFHREYLNEHLKQVHYYCKVCNKTFNSLTNITAHEKLHATKKQVFVEESIEYGERATDSSIRPRNRRLHQNIKEGRPQLSDEDSTVTVHTSPFPIVEERILLNQLPMKFQCAYCHMIISDKLSYNEHLFEKHNVPYYLSSKKYYSETTLEF